MGKSTVTGGRSSKCNSINPTKFSITGEKAVFLQTKHSISKYSPQFHTSFSFTNDIQGKGRGYEEKAGEKGEIKEEEGEGE